MFDKKKVDELFMQLWVNQGLALKQEQKSTVKLNESFRDKYHFDEWLLDRNGKRLKFKAFNQESYNGPDLRIFGSV